MVLGIRSRPVPRCSGVLACINQNRGVMKDQRVAQNLSIWRALLKRTQESVEDATGICQSNLSRWEMGKGVHDLLEAEKLADLYGCSIMDFLKGGQPGASITITYTPPPAQGPAPGA